MIIGAQKAGTSALCHFLSQHPQIGMANPKEAHLFDSANYTCEWSVREINQRYSRYFSDANETQFWGEATPIYLYWPAIVPELQRYNSALKLIVLLREPSERAISHHAMMLARGYERLPLWLALIIEPLRLRFAGKKLALAHRRFSYLNRGKYAAQLIRLRQYFPDRQILILDNSELKNLHDQTLNKIYRFLGVDEQVKITPEVVFSGQYAGSEKMNNRQLIKKILQWYFLNSNRRLKKVLSDLNIDNNWFWLR